MKPLFNPDLVYPCDEIGPYVDLEGTVVSSEGPWPDSFPVEVATEQGKFRAWAHPRMAPLASAGAKAVVRVYSKGGGFYPDDRILSLSRSGT